MVQMAFCDLSHTFHKQVTNVSPACFCHPTVGNFDVSLSPGEDSKQVVLRCQWNTGFNQFALISFAANSKRYVIYTSETGYSLSQTLKLMCHIFLTNYIFDKTKFHKF